MALLPSRVYCLHFFDLGWVLNFFEKMINLSVMNLQWRKFAKFLGLWIVFLFIFLFSCISLGRF